MRKVVMALSLFGQLALSAGRFVIAIILEKLKS